MIASQPGEDGGFNTQEPARGQTPCSDHKASPVKDRKSVSVNDCKGFELEGSGVRAPLPPRHVLGAQT